MSETIFHFRQFAINQDVCAMKVGTDAVLLGSWIQSENEKRILDIGTGTGVIALMLAQKCSGMIEAIDIDENAFIQSKGNFRNSPWFFRLHSTHKSFQDFACGTSSQFDLIVTNPPYFHHASKPAIASRSNARHSDVLCYDDLLCGVKKLLSPSGRFCLILPCKEGMEFLDKAQRTALFCNKLLHVKTKACKEKRLMMQFGFDFRLLEEDEIIIHESDGCFTDQYIEFTKDYYIQLNKNSRYEIKNADQEFKVSSRERLPE